MNDNDDLRERLLLSVQRALLGEVRAELRSVTCGWEGTHILLRFLFDGEISDDAREVASSVGAEVIADFNSDWTISEEVERLDYPSDRRPRSLPLWAFARWERNS